jgi:DNA recombination protein RmuC
MEFLFLIVGMVVGAGAIFLVERSRRARLEAELEHERRASANDATRQDVFEARLREVASHAVRELQQEARRDLDDRRQAVEQLVAPLRQSLEKVDGGVRELEKARGEAYGRLTQQVEAMAQTQASLQRETGNLVTALRAPSVRGRWGEMQLRRVVELAGMVAHCDFVEQKTATVDGRTVRPDLVIRLPGDRNIVVDAKVPLEAYLEALEAVDEDVRLARLRDHARQIRDHVLKLGAKSYWEQFPRTPDFVFLFIPGESFLSVALEHDPTLLEEGYRRGVHLVTPTSLISNLRAVAQGWRDEAVAEHARTVSDLGKELHDRLRRLADLFVKLGRSLDGAVGHYNEAAGALESRVLVTARRFTDLGVPVSDEIPPLEPVERVPRGLRAPEMVEIPPPPDVADAA